MCQTRGCMNINKSGGGRHNRGNERKDKRIYEESLEEMIEREREREREKDEREKM